MRKRQRQLAKNMIQEAKSSWTGESSRWIIQEEAQNEIETANGRLIIYDAHWQSVRFETWGNDLWTDEDIQDWLAVFFGTALPLRIKCVGKGKPKEFVSPEFYLHHRCLKTGYGVQLHRGKDMNYTRKCAIYARVSTPEQDITTQINPLMEYAKNKDYQVFDVYSDTGISGAKRNRPELDRLMKNARRGLFDVVLVWKFDRFARSTKHLVEALDEFRELGIDFFSYTEAIDTSTAIGQAMFTVISAMAQLERDLISERVKAGMSNAKLNGKKVGRPKQKLNYSLILSLRKEGLSNYKIAERLDTSEATIRRCVKKATEYQQQERDIMTIR